MNREVIMNQKQSIIIVSIVVVSLIALIAVAFADNTGAYKGRGFGKHRHHKGFGLSLLTKYQMQNLMAQTLAEMTGQPVDVINQKFETQRPRIVMQESSVDREKFRTAMQSKVKALVEQAAENGSITPEQKNDILAKMAEKSQRREVMQQLIEKGISDGTITEEQAQMLQRKSK